jgi:hypothetical protein
MAPDEAVAVPRVSDEVAWELVRDEWELLLAIGSGPTSLEAAATATGRSLEDVSRAVVRLASRGVIQNEGGSLRLIPALYERREGMASYLRDVVLGGLGPQMAAPVAGLVARGAGDLVAIASLIGAVEETLLPDVVRLASGPESAASERFSLLFVVAPGRDVVRADGLRGQLLDVLRAAAAARTLDPGGRTAYLWAAEMRADPSVAVEIGERMQGFVEDSVRAELEDGAVAFAVSPVRGAPRQAERFG